MSNFGQTAKKTGGFFGKIVLCIGNALRKYECLFIGRVVIFG